MPAFFCGGVYKGLLEGRMKVLVLAFLQRDSVAALLPVLPSSSETYVETGLEEVIGRFWAARHCVSVPLCPKVLTDLERNRWRGHAGLSASNLLSSRQQSCPSKHVPPTCVLKNVHMTKISKVHLWERCYS